MPNSNQRGGSHEQHVKAGQQSHKNDDMRQAGGRDSDTIKRDGNQDQHGKSGQPGRKS
jgi:hypothetical protein